MILSEGQDPQQFTISRRTTTRRKRQFQVQKSRQSTNLSKNNDLSSCDSSSSSDDHFEYRHKKRRILQVYSNTKGVENEGAAALSSNLTKFSKRGDLSSCRLSKSDSLEPFDYSQDCEEEIITDSTLTNSTTVNMAVNILRPENSNVIKSSLNQATKNPYQQSAQHAYGMNYPFSILVEAAVRIREFEIRMATGSAQQ